MHIKLSAATAQQQQQLLQMTDTSHRLDKLRNTQLVTVDLPTTWNIADSTSTLSAAPSFTVLRAVHRNSTWRQKDAYVSIITVRT